MYERSIKSSLSIEQTGRPSCRTQITGQITVPQKPITKKNPWILKKMHGRWPDQPPPRAVKSDQIDDPTPTPIYNSIIIIHPSPNFTTQRVNASLHYSRNRRSSVDHKSRGWTTDDLRFLILFIISRPIVTASQKLHQPWWCTSPTHDSDGFLPQ